MAQKLYNDTAVQDIANAIREKNGEPATTKYKIAEMGDAIRAIPGGGGEKPTVTDGRYLFAGDRKDLIGKVAVDTDKISYMFYQNTQVSEQDVLAALQDTDSTIGDTTDFSGFFQGCTALTEFDMENLPVKSGANDYLMLNNMFDSCTNLSTVNVSPPEGKSLRAKDLSYMFRNCESLTSVDISKIGTGSVSADRNAMQMFVNCTALENITINSTNSNFSPANTSNMFLGCTALTNFESNQFGQGNLTTCTAMFRDCTNLQKVKMSNFAVSSNGTVSMSNMFTGCTNLKTIDILWNNGNNSSISNSNMFYCPNLENLVIRTRSGVCRISSATSLALLPTTCKIYVPDSLVSSYKSATNWSARASQIYPLSQYVES